LKVLSPDVLRSSREISTFLRDEILELQNSEKKVLSVMVGVQVQGSPVPPAWRKVLEAFSHGTTLMEFYQHIEGELGASRTGRQRRIGAKNLRRRKHSQFLSTLNRLADSGILTLHPSSFLDKDGSLTWPDTDLRRSRYSGNSYTRRGWAKEISTVWVKPNLQKLKKETGSQASWTEKRTITLRKKGEGVGNVIVEGLAVKPIHLIAEPRSEKAEMSEAKDEAEAIEQEREVEATEGVEPVSEADGETMEEETEEESEEHESEQIEDRRAKTTREEKRKHLRVASASEKSDEARGRAADDGYHTREG